MADPYVDRYRSGTPEQRRAAIVKLGKAGDPGAISVLQQIISGEPDPALQKLATQAISHLQKTAADSSADQNEQVATVPPAGPAPLPESALTIDPAAGIMAGSTPVPPPAMPMQPTIARVVSLQQKKLAKAKLDQVITQQMVGQNQAALETLAEAARLDPDVLNTTIGANLVATLTGLPRDQAIAAVLARNETISAKKAPNTPVLKFEGGELFDTVLEAVVLMVLIIFVFAFFNVGGVGLVNRLFSGFGNLMANYGASDPRGLATTVAQFTTQGSANTAASTRAQATLQAESPGLANAYNQLFNNPALSTLEAQVRQGQIGATSPQFQATATAALQSAFSQAPIVIPPLRTVAFDAIGSALRLMFSTVLAIVTVYLVGLMFGGTGPILRFVRYMTRAYLVTYGLPLIGLTLWFIVSQQTTLSSSLQLTLLGIGFVIIILGALFGFGLQCFSAARAHEFGFFKGFGAVVVGGFAFGVLSVIVGLGSAFNPGR